MATLTADNFGTACPPGSPGSAPDATASDWPDRLDWRLRLDPRVEARYETEHGSERGTELRRSILVGLVFYNIYNFTGVALMPDLAELGVVARLLIVTPVSLVLAWLVTRVRSIARERLVLGGMIVAVATPILLFRLTQAPLGTYTFAETVLVVVFGNLLLALRFRHALAFTAVAFALSALAADTKADLAPELRVALLVQFGTGCVFSLFANYRMEALRCRGYLRTLAAQLTSEAADAARQRFQGLSHTDALTGLPNRRSLDQTTAAWFAEERAAALMMIDLDHFKLFNDTLGHPEGDACLCRVAALFSTFVRGPGAAPEILAARFGGEEFTIVLRDAGALEAARFAGALVRAVEELGIVHPGRCDGFAVVTISVGIALKPEGVACAGTALFEEADRALYQAKRLGRNRYALAEGAGAAAAVA